MKLNAIVIIRFIAVSLAIETHSAWAQSYQFEESEGLVIMEMESTLSPYGEWILNTTTDSANTTGEGSLEFAGDSPIGQPNPTSPLEYTFKINQGGIYFLHLHCAKLDQFDEDGVFRTDIANDCFVRVDGDYDARNPDPKDVPETKKNGKVVYDDQYHLGDAPLSMLQSDTKYFGGKNNQFDWVDGTRLDPGGHDNKRVAVYDFKSGEVYKLVVHGRSADYKINRLMFRHKNVKRKVAEDLSNPETLAQPVGPVYVKGELKRWHKVTLELDGPSTGEMASPNPFTDYRMSVTFTHTNSGLSYKVPGYFAADGSAANTSATSGNKWHAHLSPDEIGQWNYEISFREGTDVAIDSAAIAGSAVVPYDGLTGSFTVEETDKSEPDFRARGRLTYVNKHHLKFAGSGKYFIKAGADAPENLFAYNDIDDTPNDPKVNPNLRKSWVPHAEDYDATDASGYTWTDAETGELQGTELLGALRYLSEIEGLNSFSFLTFSLDGDDDNVFPHLLRSDVAGYESIEDDPAGSEGGELPTTGRWADPTHGVHHDRFDISKMAQWGKIMSYAGKKGLFMDIKTQENENDRKMDGGDLGRERKLYYRELIARFGHHLGLQWNLGEESDIHRNDELADKNQTRVKAYTQYFKDNDPYNHLVAIHSYPNEKEKKAVYKRLLGSKSQLTGASLQAGQADFSDVFDEVKSWVDQSADAGKPWVVFCDEPGDASSALRPDSNPGGGSEEDPINSHENGRKDALWGSVMAGGAGTNFYFGYEYDHSDLTCQDWRSRDNFWDYCRYMLQLFENYNIPFQDMTSDNSLTSNLDSWCLAKPGDTYLIYLRNGGTTTIDLSDVSGTYNVSWYDPRNGGALQQTSTAQVNGGNIRNLKKAPSKTSQDWVILLQNADNPSNPYMLDATADFPNITAGAIPYYRDNSQNALAIDAANKGYRGPFARATATFAGVSDVYQVTINTIGEEDGDCLYRFYVDGTLIGEVTNDPTSEAFEPQVHIIATSVEIPVGAILAVESNAVTNGLIPEGDGTAWARGRWTGLSFEPTDIVTPPSVESFTLINATTNEPVPGFDPIPDNAIINTNEIGTTSLNIRANTFPNSDFGSVIFSLTGSTNQDQVESGYPWALFLDNGGNDSGASFNNGLHSLIATPFNQDDGLGSAGDAFSLQFTVTDEDPLPPISVDSISFTNIDGYNTVTDDVVIDTYLAGTADLHIRANTTPAEDFGTVTFELSGAASVTRTDGDYTWNFKAKNHLPDKKFNNGQYTLTITPYDTEGVAGTSLTVNITVESSAPQTPYQLWEDENGLPTNSGDLDTDNDGYNNKYEFLFGLDPNNSLNPRQQTSYMDEDGFIFKTYTRRQDESITYTVEISSELTPDSWTTLGDKQYEVTSGPVGNGDGTETLTIKYNTALADIGDKLFINIKATE